MALAKYKVNQKEELFGQAASEIRITSHPTQDYILLFLCLKTGGYIENIMIFLK